MRRLILLLCFILTMFANMMAGEHRTVIISLDGCRWDYPLMYDTPNLDEIGKTDETSSTHHHLRAYKKTEVPKYLNYGTNKNIDGIVVITDIGFVYPLLTHLLGTTPAPCDGRK